MSVTGRDKCSRARTDMTPCVIKDGTMAIADDGHCVGCGIGPAYSMAQFRRIDFLLDQRDKGPDSGTGGEKE